MSDNYQIPAIISMLFSGAVIATWAIFASMRAKGIFMLMITMISFSDLMGNLPFAMGIFPSNGSVLCTFQGFCNLYFYPVSWLYTAMLAYLLRCVILTNKIPTSSVFIHGPCLLIPLVFTLLMLTTNTYGTDDDKNVYICAYGGPKASGKLWHYVTYDGLWLFCFLMMVLWFIECTMKKAAVQSVKIVNSTKRIMIIYPLIFVGLWGPFMFAEFAIGTGNHENFKLPLTIIKILYGAVTPLLFFSTSHEARFRWVRLLSCGVIHLHNCCGDVLEGDDFDDMSSLDGNSKSIEIGVDVPTHGRGSSGPGRSGEQGQEQEREYGLTMARWTLSPVHTRPSWGLAWSGGRASGNSKRSTEDAPSLDDRGRVSRMSVQDSLPWMTPMSFSTSQKGESGPHQSTHGGFKGGAPSDTLATEMVTVDAHQQATATEMVTVTVGCGAGP